MKVEEDIRRRGRSWKDVQYRRLSIKRNKRRSYTRKGEREKKKKSNKNDLPVSLLLKVLLRSNRHRHLF